QGIHVQRRTVHGGREERAHELLARSDHDLSGVDPHAGHLQRTAALNLPVLLRSKETLSQAESPLHLGVVRVTARTQIGLGSGVDHQPLQAPLKLLADARKLIGLLITAVNAVEGLPIGLAQTRHGVKASALALVNIGLDVLALQALSMLQLRDAVPEALDLGFALGIGARHIIGVSHSNSPS